MLRNIYYLIIHPFIDFLFKQNLLLGEFLLKKFSAFFIYYFYTPEIGQFLFLLCLVFLLISTSLLLVLTESPVHSLIYLMLLLLYLSQLSISFQMHFLGLIFIIIYVGCVSVLLLLHINMIISFISRYTIVKQKNYFIPLICVCIIIPLIQIITLFFSEKFLLEPMYNDLFSINFLKKINYNLNSCELPLEWNYLYETFITLNIYSKDILFLTNGFNSNMDKFLKQDSFFNYTDWISLIDNIDNTFTLGIIIFTVEFLPLIIGAFILLVSMVGCISITLEKNIHKKKQHIKMQITREINIKNILNNI